VNNSLGAHAQGAGAALTCNDGDSGEEPVHGSLHQPLLNAVLLPIAKSGSGEGWAGAGAMVQSGHNLRVELLDFTDNEKKDDPSGDAARECEKEGGGGA
jgi:hypothetical protein